MKEAEARSNRNLNNLTIKSNDDMVAEKLQREHLQEYVMAEYKEDDQNDNGCECAGVCRIHHISTPCAGARRCLRDRYGYDREE